MHQHMYTQRIEAGDMNDFETSGQKISVQLEGSGRKQKGAYRNIHQKV